MWRRPLHLLFVGAITSLGSSLVACNDPQPAGGVFLSRDSAGTEIWEHPDLANAAAESWRAAEAPFLILGQAEGSEPLLFSRIRGAAPMPEGGVAVADGLSNEIRLFDGNGTHLHTAGGTGSGPGEFTRLRKAFLYRSDSIVATNFTGGILHVFGSTGILGRSLTCDPASPSLSALHPEGALAGGEFLVRAMQQLQTEIPTEGYHREHSIFHLCNPDGSSGPLLAKLPDLEFGTVIEAGRPMSYPLEMGRRAVSAVVGDAVFVGVTDRLELWRYDSSGVLTAILRAANRPAPVDEEIKDRWMEFRLRGIEDVEDARRIRQRYRELPWPDSMPAFSDLKGDSEGNLWVRQFVPPYASGPGVWWVFSADGALRARVTLPADFRVESIGSDSVLGVMEDELGVERVYSFQLEKGQRL